SDVCSSDLKAQLRDLPTVVHGQQRDGGIIVQVLSNSWHASLFTFFHPTPLRPSSFGKILSAQKRRLHSRVSTPRKHRTPPTSSKGTDDRDSPPRRKIKQILRRPPRTEGHELLRPTGRDLRLRRFQRCGKIHDDAHRSGCPGS